MTAFQMFKSAKVKRLETELDELKDNRDFHFRRLRESMETTRRVYQMLYKTQDDLADMTECRDTLQAVIAELNKELAEAKFNLIDVSFGSRLVLDVVRMERDEKSLLDTITTIQAKCDMQANTLRMIAQYGEDNPNWAARIARATLETKTGIYKEGPKTAIQVGTEFAESLKESFRRSNTESKGE